MAKETKILFEFYGSDSTLRVEEHQFDLGAPLWLLVERLHDDSMNVMNIQITESAAKRLVTWLERIRSN